LRASHISASESAESILSDCYRHKSVLDALISIDCIFVFLSVIPLQTHDLLLHTGQYLMAEARPSNARGSHT
jgi:hypothetical protein